MVRLGIIGLPAAGKTSIFNALTAGDSPVDGRSSAGLVEVHTGVVDLQDHRLESLSALYQPRKTTPAQLTFGDINGLHEDGSVSGEFVNQLAQWDGLILVLRAFEHPATGRPPALEHDLNAVASEFLLSDVLRVDSRLERLQEDRRKGARDRADVDREIKLFRRLAKHLEDERPLRDLELVSEDRAALHGPGLLTLKPLIVVQNLPEGAQPGPLDTTLTWVAVHGKLEMELAQLAQDEAEQFRAEFGIEVPGVSRLLAECLKLLKRITFFTVSEPEVKAWLLQEGDTALDAAGTIHSDMQRGFIRAEVIAWDELVKLGGLIEARQAGKLRVEGKGYVPTDGEVIHVRFNV